MTPHLFLRVANSTPAFSNRTPARNASSFKRLTALSLALLLLPMSQADLFAQQAPYYPGPQQPYSYSPQYDPGQQYQQSYGQPEYGAPQPGYGQQQALGPDQLEQLVAPIALYPDQLVALMLAASTYPAQVADADHWRQAQGYASSDQIAYGAGLQAWDPSVKALTAFPQILAGMDQNIQWTSALGNAYYNQPQDVLEAIQIMRQRAQAAGNLQTTPEEAVSYNQGYIQVAPVNPQVIYVPAYNPWAVYGQPVTPYPGFSLLGALGSFFNSGFGSSAVRFGLGTVLSAFSHSPFGLIAWGLNWLTQNLLFHSNNYYSHSTTVVDWGLRYGGPRAYMAPHRSLVVYNRGYGQSYGRGGYGQNFNRTPDRYAGNYNRNYQSSAYSYNRNQQYSRTNYGSNYNSNYRSGIYNRPQSPFANRSGYNDNRSYQGFNRNNMPARSQQQYARSSYGSNYGSGFADRSHPAYNVRSNYASGNSYQSYRAPSSSFDRNTFNQRSEYRGNAFAGDSFNGRSSHSGGFHPFGGGHNSNSFGREESFKAPKFKEPKYKAPKAPKAPKMHGGSGGYHSGGGHHH
jgi:Protein of unknown function (DUF3300)